MEHQGKEYGMQLYVEFKNKDIVKKAGAKWNVNKKYWYCPSSIDKDKLKILLELEEVNFIKNGKEFCRKDEVNNIFEEYNNVNVIVVEEEKFDVMKKMYPNYAK